MMKQNKIMPSSLVDLKRAAKSRKLLAFFVVAAIVVGLICSLWFVFSISAPMRLPADSIKFTIVEGQGVNQISYNLKYRGIIKNSFVFETYVYLKDVEHNFQVASYDLPEVLNIKRLVEILTTRQNAEEWNLTVIEGWTAREIAARLANTGKFEEDDFLAAVAAGEIDFSSEFDFLSDKPIKESLEGYLFPDTYKYFAKATVRDVIKKMLTNFDKKLSEKMRADILAQEKTIFDVVIMASIIEREVRTDADRPIVAGIFWKRLDAGMALEADSTVNYVTGKKMPAVVFDDLEIDSLYNTYKYPGLPPGPICNPGLAAIEAAVYPEVSDYWFFLTDDEGNVHYASDFNAHIENKNKYLK